MQKQISTFFGPAQFFLIFFVPLMFSGIVPILKNYVVTLSLKENGSKISNVHSFTNYT